METKFPHILLITFQLFFVSGVKGSPSFKSAMQVENVPDLIRFDGYPVEVHHALTEDGYIVELHRIPAGRNETNTGSGARNSKPVVFLTHCVFCSSAAYVVLGPNGGLAYMLANSGYDVWMINARGTRYSRRHVRLSPSTRKFWQFSWHEQGVLDLPAGIDYVLKETGQKTLNAIGFSMGSTQYFCLLSERPEYNKKIRSLTVLAPAVYVGNSRSPLVNIFEAFGHKIVRTLPFYFKFFPDSTSLRTVIHFWQIQQTGRFRKYNYGRALNAKIYGTQTPPDYDLSKVMTPVNLLWSSGDNLTVAKDVKKLRDVLPNVNTTYEIPDKSFSHIDFIW